MVSTICTSRPSFLRYDVVPGAKSRGHAKVDDNRKDAGLHDGLQTMAKLARVPVNWNLNTASPVAW